MKVLYLAAVPHSGSTILANALGELDGYFAGGELHFLSHVVRAGRTCGCGAAFDECPVWSRVLKDEPPTPDDRWLLARNLPSIALGRPPGGEGALDRYVAAVGDLYRRIHDVTGCRVLVDSSKSPAYAHLLGRVPGIELFVVHLVRNPHATRFSWERYGKRLDVHPSKFGLIWSYWNAAIPLVRRGSGHYRVVRHEDFVARPAEVLREVAEFVGEPVASLPFLAGRTLKLGVNHTAAGNENRFRSGTVAIRADDAWRDRVTVRAAIETALATWPLQLRHGYPLVPEPRGTAKASRPAAPTHGR